MTDAPEATEESRADSRSAAGRSRPDPPPTDLRATVVRYDDGPDRCTIYPADAAGLERMATWLSADADVFVRIAEMR